MARMAMVEVERTIHKLAQEGTPELQGEVVWRVARSASPYSSRCHLSVIIANIVEP